MSCCNKNISTSNKGEEQEIYENVNEYYGKVLNQTSDLKTSACTTSSRPPKVIRDILKLVPKEVKDKYYGCGTPIPLGLKEGMNVLDLGSGSGQDCYMASKLVGESGTVTGIDMTDEQLQVANKHSESYCKEVLKFSKSNMKFVKGYIEFLEKAGIAPNSLDLVISNCVVNLSPNKKLVLQEVYKSLKEGGEFYFSDVYCSRRLPEDVRKHKVLFGECIAGALYVEDFKRLCREVGFTDPRIMTQSEIKITDAELSDVVGEAKFFSITFRLFKLKNLETLCEDYGQVAIYKGGIEGQKHSYKLDDHHLFELNKPELVCGNTASMLSESWLKPYFHIIGNRDTHYGLFDCSGSKPLPTNDSEASSSSGGAGCGSSCC